MFEIFAIVIAFIFSSIAGLWDLFTTEVPDEVLAILITFGIFNWYVYSASSGDITPLFFSLTIGTFVLIIGLIMYKFGQWGGADAWLFAAIAYTIPLYGNRIFMLDYIFNFLIVSSFYMVVYVFILGVINRHVFSYFVDDIRNKWQLVLFALIVPCSLLIIFYLMSYRIMALPVIELMVLVTLLVLFWRYAKVIDKRVFRKTIPASKLKPGDVLDDMIWKGMTDEDVAKIKKSKKTVVIKEGVRLVPAFPITLVITLMYGNLMFYII